MSNGCDASGRVPETAPPAGVSLRGSIGRRGSRRTLALILIVLLLAAGLLAVVADKRDQHSHRPAGSAMPNSDDLAAVMSVLNAHGKALLARDAAGWRSALDDRSGSFSAQQEAVFDNLAHVPLSAWRYTLDASVNSPDVLGPAAQRLGGRVAVLHVTLRYALAVVDLQPTGKDLWLTAVDRSGRWLLAGDSDAAAAGGVSWRGPWDFGPLVVRAGAHTLVLAHPAHAGDLARFGSLVEQSVPVVTRVWGSQWNSHVAVIIPDTDAEFAAVTADTGDTSDLAAVAVADQVLPDGTVLGARIVLNPTNLQRLDDAGRRLVVQHELTHIASRAMTNDQMPTWVIEGFADYVGNLGSALSVRQSAAELAAEVRRGLLPSMLPSNADFSGSAARLPQIYEQAWLACRLIARRVGQPGLVRFYKAVSQAARADPDKAAGTAFKAVLGIDETAFVRIWRQDLRAELA